MTSTSILQSYPAQPSPNSIILIRPSPASIPHRFGEIGGDSNGRDNPSNHAGFSEWAVENMEAVEVMESITSPPPHLQHPARRGTSQLGEGSGQ